MYSAEGVFGSKNRRHGQRWTSSTTVGLSLAADGASVLVADMYNARVVILDTTSGQQTGQFTVEG